MNRIFRSALVGLAALVAASGISQGADLVLSTGTQFQPGFRLVDGSDLNKVLNAVNTLNAQAAGTTAGTYIGTFKSSTYPPSSGAQFFGAGTSAAPFALGTTADQTVGRLYGTALNTTGYARALDARMYFGGVGGEGEAVRAYGIVNNVTAATGGTVNGIHASLSVTGASGKVSGAGHAIRGTLELGTGGTVGGTIDVLQLDTFAEGTVPATAAFISLANIGTNKLPYLMRVTLPDAAMFVNAGTGAGSCGLAGGMVAAKVFKIVVDGTDYWLPLCSSNGS